MYKKWRKSWSKTRTLLPLGLGGILSTGFSIWWRFSRTVLHFCRHSKDDERLILRVAPLFESSENRDADGVSTDSILVVIPDESSAGILLYG